MRRYLNRPSHGTIVAYMALFVALGGTAVATTQGFVLGSTNRVDAATAVTNVKADGNQNAIANPLLGLTNLTTGTGATALGLNVASGHPPFTTNSATKVANLNADKLDGIDSTGLIQGQGRIVTGDTTVATGALGTVLALPGFVTVQGGCNGTAGNGSYFITTGPHPVNELSDNGESNPDHETLPASTPLISYSAWATAPAGEYITFSFESGGKVATLFEFSYAFFNPTLNHDVCAYQGFAVVHGA
jgi:hypothetical protein